MSRGLLSWLIVLVIAALLSAAVVGHYASVPVWTAAGPLSKGGGYSATNTILHGANGNSQPPEGFANEVPPAQSAPKLDNGADAAAAPENFRDWFQRYAAAHPDRHRLRQELEAALAQLPADDGPPSTPEALNAFQALRRAEQMAGNDYAALVDQAERFLEVYSNSPLSAEVRELFAKYSRAWDEHDFASAREFSRANPDRFESRVARYQAYLEHHAAAGQYVADARTAIETSRADWAEHDYLAIGEFSKRYPHDAAAVAGRLRKFIDDHPSSERRRVADQFLARYEKAAVSGEYRVRVKSAAFAHNIARSLSLGPDLAVEIEVAGVRIGRTPIVPDSFEPVWNYEFPQNIRWRMGDPVKIRVIDFDYSNRTILKFESAPDDPLALRLLTHTLSAEGHQITFQCDFEPPSLPAPSERR